ncbi:hypothetical protein D3C72_2254830 [compost metagenome]
MREDREVAFAARADVDMAAFARHGKPCVLGMNEAGHAEPGSGSQNDTRRHGTVIIGADRRAILVG